VRAASGVEDALLREAVAERRRGREGGAITVIDHAFQRNAQKISSSAERAAGRVGGTIREIAACDPIEASSGRRE